MPLQSVECGVTPTIEHESVPDSSVVKGVFAISQIDGWLRPDGRKRTTNSCIHANMLVRLPFARELPRLGLDIERLSARCEDRDESVVSDECFVFYLECHVHDVVVSVHYDDRNRYREPVSFADDCRREGPVTGREVIRCHGVRWGVRPRIIMVSYEGVEEEFATEVRCMGETLGMTFDDGWGGWVYEKNSFGRLRKRYANQALYRSKRVFQAGASDDSRNHVDTGTVRDIKKIKVSGLRPFDWRSLLRWASAQLPLGPG